MVEKITKLSVATTQEQLNTEWVKVISRRNKLLSYSDWTQLKDVKISDEDYAKWKDWRKKLRKIVKSAFRDSADANASLDILEREMPKDSRIIESENEQVIENNVIEKVYIKQQPIVLNHRLSLDDFKSLFYQLFEQNPYDFQTYLRSLLSADIKVIFYDNDSLNEAKNKSIKFLKEKQREILIEKMNQISCREILNQKVEEALDFLSSKDKDIDIQDFPLIDIHSQLLEKSPKDVALEFLEERKKYNKIIFDAERFLLYGINQINQCDTLIDLRELTEELKRGY